ncbi:rhamnosyltransferase WsaF family glycosyltransferase [Salinimonas lutimaris]|uniref:rhamnosyltransferase WsaF family glycosyltransferase n=1 Tax=Salinimonas lutimaris TaxID=914153 RepID=UPI0010BFF604|nr:glycosyltransferase [Salinimonas lutimaris]
MLTFKRKSDSNKDLLQLKNSILFNKEFYLEQNRDVAQAGIDPFEHYLNFGFKEGRNPNPYFDSKWYSNEYRLANDENPLLHYLSKGWKQNNKTIGWFDISEYRKIANLNIEVDPLEHFLTAGDVKQVKDFFKPTADWAYNFLKSTKAFDKNWYLERYPDLQNVDIDPLWHFCHAGAFEDRDPHRYFKTKWYRQTNMIPYDVNPLLHFLIFGQDENRHPSFELNIKDFSERYKLKENCVDVLTFISETNNIIINRLDYGRNDVKRIIDSKLFLFGWYGMEYPDLKGQDFLLHYCLHGYKEGRNPNPFFDSSWYSKTYLTDSLDTEKVVNPLLHYIEIGAKNGYHPSVRFDIQKYLKEYLKDKTIEPLSYYLHYGRNENHIAYEVRGEISGLEKSITTRSSVLPYHLSGYSYFKDSELTPGSKIFHKKNLNIHFVVPDFGVGGGGHMNIFRMLQYFEKFGHSITIWIYNPTLHITEDDAYQDIVRYYYTLKAEVKFVDEYFVKKASGDIIIASSWDTVYPVMAARSFKSRFYFVQDYEPLFYPTGAMSELAKLTYKKNIDCICASSWLEHVMSSKFNRWATSFELAADQTIFYPRRDIERISNTPVIVLYARIHTERRAVELALLALDKLYSKGVSFHVVMYGIEASPSDFPFSCEVYKSRTPEQLATIYNSGTIGVVFSMTNYSLVPQEMMASGLPVLEFDCESTQYTYPEGTVTLSGPDPQDIAAKIEELLLNKTLREQQAKKALSWVEKFSWYGAATKVEKSILSRLEEKGFVEANETPGNTSCKATVVIPTYNGGSLLHEVIDRIKDQHVPWQYEILIIDSSSTDGSVDKYINDGRINLKVIPQKDFNHGATRNFAVEIAEGEFVAFITQDALPADSMWLYNLVSVLEHYSDAAGVYGKHIAHKNATFYTKREIENHFDGLNCYSLIKSKHTEKPNDISDEHWMGILRFYSDNNSCLRKSAWKNIPYREVKYGEDQVWASDIINSGGAIVYSPSAIVEHSHDYSAEDTYARSLIDGDYFNYFWEEKIVDDINVDKVIKEFKKEAKKVGLENGFSDEIILERCKIIEARYKGYLDGSKSSPSLFCSTNNKRSKF